MLGRSHVLEAVLDVVMLVFVFVFASRVLVMVSRSVALLWAGCDVARLYACRVLRATEEHVRSLVWWGARRVVACVRVGDVEPDMSLLYPYGSGSGV